MANPFNIMNNQRQINQGNNQMRNLYQAFSNSQNPYQLLENMSMNNPQLQPIVQALRNGNNPQQLFINMCQQRGINPQAFINNLIK